MTTLDDTDHEQGPTADTADPGTGVCVWLTGRSGAGKTTVTDVLVPMLERGGRTVTVLDEEPLLAKAPGERSSEAKLLRKAFVAKEVARHGGITICVTVSAGRAVRERARQIVGAERFIEVYFDLPADVAETRRSQRGSRRSLTKRAKKMFRRGVGRLAGRRVSDHQPPRAADVTIRADRESPEEGAGHIIDALVRRGFLQLESPS